LTSSGTAYGPDTSTDELLAGRDLTGTTALVTGASGGLGLETARGLAAHGASVIAAARDVPKTEAALAAAGVATGGSTSVVHLDLASLDSVRACADQVAATHERLDLLFANAGVMACPEGRTADGFETHLGTNHLGHFVLVNRLVPLLVAAAPSRVICLASAGHHFAAVDFDDPNWSTTPYDSLIAYSASKDANVLFAVELDRRLRDRGVRAVAVHPGTIFTDLPRHLSEEAKQYMASRPTKSVPAGAATSIWAAVVADADTVGGRYAEDCALAIVSDEPLDPLAGKVSGVHPRALDPERAARLWTLSEELVHEHFEL
jgi:NAD(P)-dependent dehydrogenase (short-subunit alcohol dehydrogenase family)